MLYLIAPNELTALALLYQSEVHSNSPLNLTMDELSTQPDALKQASLNLRQVGLVVVQQEKLMLSPMGELLCQCLLAPDQLVQVGRTSNTRNSTVYYCAHQGLWAAVSSDLALALEYIFFPLRPEDALLHAQETLALESITQPSAIDISLSISESLILLLSQGVMARRVKHFQRVLEADELWFSSTELFQEAVLEETLELAILLPHTPSPETVLDGIASPAQVRDSLTALVDKGVLELNETEQGLVIFRYTPLALDHLTQDGLLDQLYIQSVIKQAYFHYRASGLLQVTEQAGVIHYKSLAQIPVETFFPASSQTQAKPIIDSDQAEENTFCNTDCNLFCSNCGGVVGKDDRFCMHCGQRLNSS